MCTLIQHTQQTKIDKRASIFFILLKSVIFIYSQLIKKWNISYTDICTQKTSLADTVVYST